MSQNMGTFKTRALAEAFVAAELAIFGGGTIKEKTMNGAQVYKVYVPDTVKIMYYDRIYQAKFAAEHARHCEGGR